MLLPHSEVLDEFDVQGSFCCRCWNDSTKLGLLLDFLYRHDTVVPPEMLRDYLQKVADEENAGSSIVDHEVADEENA